LSACLNRRILLMLRPFSNTSLDSERGIMIGECSSTAPI